MNKFSIEYKERLFDRANQALFNYYKTNNYPLSDLDDFQTWINKTRKWSWLTFLGAGCTSLLGSSLLSSPSILNAFLLPISAAGTVYAFRKYLKIANINTEELKYANSISCFIEKVISKRSQHMPYLKLPKEVWEVLSKYTMVGIPKYTISKEHVEYDIYRNPNIPFKIYLGQEPKENKLFTINWKYGGIPISLKTTLAYLLINYDQWKNNIKSDEEYYLTNLKIISELHDEIAYKESFLKNCIFTDFPAFNGLFKLLFEHEKTTVEKKETLLAVKHNMIKINFPLSLTILPINEFKAKLDCLELPEIKQLIELMEKRKENPIIEDFDKEYEIFTNALMTYYNYLDNQYVQPYLAE